MPGVIAETDRLETNLLVEARQQRGPLDVGDARRFVQQFFDSACACGRLQQVRNKLADISDGPRKREEERLKGRQRADRDLVPVGHGGAHPEHHHLEDERADRRRSFEQRTEERGPNAGHAELCQAAIEPACGDLFQAECFDYGMRGNILLNDAHEFAFVDLALIVGGGRAANYQTGSEQADRDHEASDKGQPPIEHEEHNERHNRVQRGNETPRRGRRERAFDGGEVGGKAGGDGCDLHASEEIHGEAEQAIEHLTAQTIQD